MFIRISYNDGYEDLISVSKEQVDDIRFLALFTEETYGPIRKVMTALKELISDMEKEE